MWSNAFCQSLELRFPDRSGRVYRLFGAPIRGIVAHASGCWSLDLGRGDWLDVRLEHGWIGGGSRVIGLRWIAPDRRRFACGLCCLEPDLDRWRRLLVRLRVPKAVRLS